MDVSLEVANWLSQHGVVEHVYSYQAGSGKVSLDRATAASLVSGVAFAALLRRLCALRDAPTPPALLHVTDPASAAANWDAISQGLRALGISLDRDLVALAQAGKDAAVVADLLHQVFLRETAPAPVARAPVAQQAPPPRPIAKRADPAAAVAPPARVSDFVSQVLQDALSLTKAVADGLVGPNLRRLQKGFVEGLEGQFQPVIKVLQQLFAQSSVLAHVVIAAGKGNPHHTRHQLTWILDLLARAMACPHPEVALWSLRILNRLGAAVYGELGHIEDGWDWLVKEGGLRGLFACYQRHPEIRTLVYGVMDLFSSGHYSDLFSRHLLAVSPDQTAFMAFAHDYLEGATLRHLEASGAPPYWLDHAIRHSTAENAPEIRGAALALAAELWIKFPEQTESRPGCVRKVISMLRKASRDADQGLAATAHAVLFHILESMGPTDPGLAQVGTAAATAAPLARPSPSFAGLVLKSAVSSLSTSTMPQAVRHLVTSNLYELLDAGCPYIAPDLAVDPLVSYANLHGILSTDFDALTSLASHQGLGIRAALQLYDLVARLSVNDSLYSRSACVPMAILIDRFYSEPVFADRVTAFCTSVLALLFRIEKANHDSLNSKDGLSGYHMRKTMISSALGVTFSKHRALNDALEPFFLSALCATEAATGLPCGPLRAMFRFFPDAQARLQALTAAEITAMLSAGWLHQAIDPMFDTFVVVTKGGAAGAGAGSDEAGGPGMGAPASTDPGKQLALAEIQRGGAPEKLLLNVSADVHCALPVGKDQVWTGERDGTIAIRDARTGAILERLLDHQGQMLVWCMAMVKGHVWAGTAHGLVLVYNPATRQPMARLRQHMGGVRAMLHAPALPEAVFTGSADFTILQWSSAQRESVVRFKGHTDAVRALAVAGGRLWSGSDDCTIRVWVPAGGDQVSAASAVRVLTGHSGAVLSLCAATPGTVWSSSEDRTLRQWQVAGQSQCLREISNLASRVTSLVATGHNKMWAAADACMYVVHTETGKVLKTVQAETKGISALAPIRRTEARYMWSWSVGQRAIQIWQQETTDLDATQGDRERDAMALNLVLTEEIAKLKKLLAQARSAEPEQVKMAQTVATAAQTSAEEMRAQLVQTQSLLTQRDERIRELEVVVQSRAASAGASHTQLSKEVESLKRKLAETEQRLKEARDEHDHDLQKRTLDENKAIEELRKEQARLKAELASERESALNKLMGDMSAQHQDQLQSLRDQLDKVRADADRVRQLQLDTASQSEAALGAERESRRALERRISELDDAVRHARTAEEEMASKLADAQAALRREEELRQEDLLRLQASHDRTVAELESTHTKSLESMRQEHAEAMTHAHGSIGRLEERIKDLKSQMATEQQEFKARRDSLTVRVQKMSDSREGSLRQTTMEVAALRHHIDELEEKLRVATSRTEELEAQLRAAEQDKARMESEAARDREHADDRFAQAEKAWEARMSDKEALVEEKRQALAKTQADLELARTRVHDLEKEVRTVDKKKHESAVALSKVTEDTKKLENSMQARIKDLETRLSSSEKQVKLLEGQKIDAAKEAAKTAERLQAVADTLRKELEMQRADARKEMQRMRDDHKAAVANMESASREKATVLRKEKDDMARRLSKEQGDERQRLEDEHEKVVASMSAQFEESLQKMRDTHSKAIEAAEKKYGALEQKLADESSKLAEIERTLATVREDLSFVTNERNALLDRIAKLENKIQELTAARDRATSQAEQLNIKLLRSKKDHKTSSSRADDLARQLKENQRQLDEAKESIEQLHKQLLSYDIFKLDFIARELRELDRIMQHARGSLGSLHAKAARQLPPTHREAFAISLKEAQTEVSQAKSKIAEIISVCLSEVQKLHIGVAMSAPNAMLAQKLQALQEAQKAVAN